MKILFPAAIIGLAITWPKLVVDLSLPAMTAYFPDVVSGLIAVVLITRIVLQGAKPGIPLAFWVTFLGFVYVCLSGVLINQVGSDTIFAGARVYFRYLPLVLLPVAYVYTAADYQRLLKIGAFFALIQLPVCVYQAFVGVRGELGVGDLVTGTMTTASSVTVLSALSVGFVLALFIDKKVSGARALLLAVAFAVPAAISEAKAAPLLYFAAGSLILVLRWRVIAFKQLIPLVASGVIVVVAYIGLYNWIFQSEEVDSYQDTMLALSGTEGNYNYQGIEVLPFSIPIVRSDNSSIAKSKPRFEQDVAEVGRFDSATIPFQLLFPDKTLYLLMGLGVGNVDTTFGKGGDYLIIEERLGGTSTAFSMLVWEVGLLGTGFFFLFIANVARMSQRLSANPELGTYGLIICASTVVYSASLFYANMFHAPEVTSIYMFLVGAAIGINRQMPEVFRTVESGNGAFLIRSST